MKDRAAGSVDVPPQLGGLETLLRDNALRGAAPVESWNPPYCGDIGLAIKRDGTWLYQSGPITRRPMVELFARVLRRDEDGRYYLVTPAEKVDVIVEDAPFLAVELDVRDHGRGQSVLFRTNLDDVATCGPEHPLRFEIEHGTDGLKPYVHVRGRLEALCTRALTHALLGMFTQHDGRSGLWSGGTFFPVPEVGS